MSARDALSAHATPLVRGPVSTEGDILRNGLGLVERRAATPAGIASTNRECSPHPGVGSTRDLHRLNGSTCRRPLHVPAELMRNPARLAHASRVSLIRTRRPHGKDRGGLSLNVLVEAALVRSA